MRRFCSTLTPHLSHVKGDTSTPLLDDTIGGFFKKQAVKYGSDRFIVVPQQKIDKTYGEFAEHVERLATGLLQAGYRRGERIGVWMPNYYEWMLTQFAAHRLGLVLVNVNPGYRRHELRHALNLVECKGLVITPQYKGSNYEELLTTLCPEMTSVAYGEELHCEAVPSLRHVFVRGDEKPFQGAVSIHDLQPARPDTEALEEHTEGMGVRDAANIQFTSGTTGLPKAATLTNQGILNNGYFVGERLKYTSADSICLPVPLYHCFGSVLGVMAAVTHGSSIILPCPTFDPLASLQAVDRYKCTSLYGVPTMFIQELDHPRFKEFSKASLRTGIMAGSTCPPEVMARVENEMGMKEITICYGMTETSPVSFQSTTDLESRLRCETVGSIHPHVEVKVVDEKGEIVKRGEAGELLTKGYLVMEGYWGQEDETQKSIVDGFMKTGDLASIDENGLCRIIGRKGDMIIRGGENIYPSEIENFLHTHPGVSDVAVLGLPHEVFGEEVAAFIIPKPGANITLDVLREHCKDEIAHYKVPTALFIVDSFALTVTGKVQKFVMKERAVSGDLVRSA